MTDRPILFGGDMVRAILDGRKTQTRRVVKLDVHWVNDGAMAVGAKRGGTSTGPCHCFCPFQKGMKLWVKETFSKPLPLDVQDCKFTGFYRASDTDRLVKWTPSIYMPRWASRITLEITDVRVERLQDISRADCTAEGIVGLDGAWKKWETPYANLWNSINASKHPWSSNPWVWAITFRRIET